MKRLWSVCLLSPVVLACSSSSTESEAPADTAAVTDTAADASPVPDTAAEDATTESDSASAPDTTPDPDAGPKPVADLVFPESFLFGTAVAGFQVDMGCPTLPASECDDPSSDWYAYITSDEMKADGSTSLAGDPPSAGPGFWELFAEDFDRVKNELHGNGLRMSFEWSRVFPTATDGATGFDAMKALANPKALAGYHAQLKALKDRGITPLVTLNHYTLPTWIHDGVGCHKDIKNCSPKGWVDHDRTVREIAKYAGFMAQEFGGEVDLWATENEPFAVIFPGYIFPSADRTNPPAVTLASVEARTVFSALIVAHARMYDAVKAGDSVDADGDGAASSVGLVYSLSPVKPMHADVPLDVQAAKNVFYLWNAAFLNGVIKGDLDDDLDGVAQHHDDLAGRMDFLGVNFYTRITVEGVDTPLVPDLSALTTFNLLTLVPWEDYTKGIYEMIMVVKDYGLPCYITETGTADNDDSGKQSKWLAETLTWVHRAITDGADVRGYFYWTLMDNYEWNHGMKQMRMGLYAVDSTDPQKVRTARNGVPLYAEIAGTRTISAQVQAKYPVEAPAP